MTVGLEDLKPEAQVKGLVGRESVRIASAEMMGDAARKVVFRSQDGALGDQFLFRSNEADLPPRLHPLGHRKAVPGRIAVPGGGSHRRSRRLPMRRAEIFPEKV